MQGRDTHTNRLEFVVCVCVCPPGDGWFLQVSNLRIVLVVQRGLRAGRQHQCWARSGNCCCTGTGFTFFLLAGVDTTRGPPHPLVPTDRILVVPQKGA